MNKLSPSIREKRFLITWIGICSFALFLNLANVNGKISRPKGKDQFLFFYSSEKYGHNYDDDFYPFTDFIVDNSIPYPNLYYSDSAHLGYTYTRFNGIFNSYNFPEFIFYTILGLCIVFIPKLWK